VQAFDVTGGGTGAVTFQLDCSESDGDAYEHCDTTVTVADGYTLYSLPTLNFVPSGWTGFYLNNARVTSLTLDDLCNGAYWLRTFGYEDGTIASGSFRVTDLLTAETSTIAVAVDASTTPYIVDAYEAGNHHVDLSKAQFTGLSVITRYCGEGAAPTSGDHALRIETLMVDDVGAVGRSALTLTVQVPER
jgi:hypothetical protein